MKLQNAIYHLTRRRESERERESERDKHRIARSPAEAGDEFELRGEIASESERERNRDPTISSTDPLFLTTASLRSRISERRRKWRRDFHFDER